MMAIFCVLALVVVLPIAWFASEFQDRMWLRMVLGGLAIFASFGVFYVAAKLERLNYNAWYGAATQELVAAEIEALEAGRHDLLEDELRRFREQFQPTYENRANYDDLAEQVAERIKAALRATPTSRPDP